MTTTVRLTEEERQAQLTALGFALECDKVPSGLVEGDWPCICYGVRLAFKGSAVMATRFKLGIGHVEWPKLQPWEHKGDKQQQATKAAALARKQNVTPTLPAVLHSLLLDGSPFFQAQSFEDWASDYGYEVDSRKAEAIYRECDSIGRKLAAAIDPETLQAARAILEDY